MRVAQQINGALRRVPPWALYIVGVLPAVWLAVQLLTYNLGVDPVKALEHKLGEIGLQFLIASLAITPLRTHAGINLIRFRRAIGLLAFFYIVLHLAVWLAFDIQFLWDQILRDILKRPYITIGMAGLVLMLPLAVTSNDWSLRRMGAAAWRRLHKLAYPAVLAGALHYVMLVKGWQLEPMLYLGTVILLLALRIRPRPRRVAA